MIAALNSTVHVSFLRIFEPPFLASRERLADTHSGTFVCAVKGQCAELPPCTQMPCFAPAQAVQLGPPGWYQPQNNRVHDGGTIPWHVATHETAGKPAGFVEGNRDVPASRR